MAIIIQWMRHKRHSCNKERCYVCEGGLFACVVCGGAEGALTTHCPGKKLSAEVIDSVYAGNVDFRSGEWVAASRWECSS